MYQPDPKLIVFEGLDGTGKTSCAKLVAERIGAVLMTTPAQDQKEMVRQLIAGYGESQEARQLLYLSSVVKASDSARSLLARGHSVVVDRYFLSTQIYAEFRGTTLDARELIGSRLQKADLTIFLEAPVGERLRRISTRSEVSPEDRETLSDAAQSDLTRRFEESFGLPVVGALQRIETLGRTEYGVADVVLSRILHLSQEATL